MLVGVPNDRDISSPGTIDDDLSCMTEELQTIVVVMRHGDRSPKQKMKFLSKSPAILELFKLRQKIEGQVKVVKLRTCQDLIAFQKLNDTILDQENLTAGARENHINVKSLLSTKELIEITRKVQLVPPKGFNSIPEEIMVVVKWGGELTSLGLESSEALGHQLRELLYPGDSDGLLRLHSTFRHDFKIYTSDEGR